MLVATILVSGLLLGFGVGYPISQLELDVESAVTLDHSALVGDFVPEEALAQLQDLPANFVQLDGDASAFGVIGASFCGETSSLENQLGERLMRAFNTPDGQLVTSEVVRARRPIDVSNYVRDVDRAFDNCSQDSFFRTTGDQRVEVKIKAGQPDPPVNDYVTRTLQPEGEGNTQVVVVFQVGDVVVALQYFGAVKPPPSLLGDVQMGILQRTAPAEFTPQRDVDGVVPVPTDPTTTTAVIPSTVPEGVTTTTGKR